MPLELKSIPLGYRLAAEWEPQRAIILAWPHNKETWPDQLDAVQGAYIHYIREIVQEQDVWLLQDNDKFQGDILSRLNEQNVPTNRIQFLNIPTFDAWVRDYGPLSLVHDNSETLFTSWVFNGWGEKYDIGYAKDNLVPEMLASHFNINWINKLQVLEGGSIDVNGKGSLLTTTDCLLNSNRNEELNQQQIEDLLKKELGQSNIIWLNAEISGDDTDGHVDDVARFVNATTVVCVCEEDSADINYKPTQSLVEQLQTARDQDGNLLDVIRLPMPEPVTYDGLRLPASYANFLITNHKVLVPTFGCTQDQTAIGILQELFPNRRVIGIRANDLVYGLGSLHCLSMQVPV